MHWGQFGLVGILAALAMITSYQGVPLLVVATLFALQASWHGRTVSRFAVYVIGVSLVGAWPLRRFLYFWLDGVRPAFVSNDGTNFYGMLAGILSAFQNDVFGTLVVWLYDRSWSDVVVVTGFYVLLLALLGYTGWKRPGWRPLALFVMLYVSILVLRLGSAGLTSFEPRVNTPIYGLLFIFLVHAGYEFSCRWPRIKGVMSGLGLAVVLAMIYVQIGRYPNLLKGHGEMCHIPKTVEWITSHLLPGAGIVTTQCGYQIHASTNDYYLRLIPPAGDVENVVRWGQDDFVRACANLSSLWVVLFDGRDGGRYLDPFIENPGYGDFVKSLLSGTAGERIKWVTKTAEGVVFRLDCQSETGTSH